jgi:Fanconi anemia group M protein
MEIKDFTPRPYQEAIVNTAKYQNTLAVLPTGIGKTALSILLSLHRLKQYPNSKILILAPSKPLCNQHIQTFKKYTTVPEKEILLLTGAISPKKREILWKDAQIIIATPQTIQKDLENNRILLENFSMICIDECHRSRLKFANTIVTKYYIKQSIHRRILALTASPGSTKEKIKEICENLNIEAVEIRTEQDHDVKPFVQERKIEWITVELPKEFKTIGEKLKRVYKEKLETLEKFGIRKNANKRELLLLQIRLQKGIKKSYSSFYGISLVAQALKLSYAMELVETQGLEQLQTYWNKLKNEKTKAAQAILNNQEIQNAVELTNKHLELKHPKMQKIKEIMIENFKKNPDSRIIIFANYRNTIDILMKELNKLKEIKAINLVGQKEGLTQKEQINRIKQFAEGTFNTLICTNIGEEGLDIATADFAIFYEPIPSEIRTIQRKGRVARITKGKIIFLITKSTRDEAYYWSSKRKEKTMHSTLYRMKNKLEKQDILI